MNNPTNNPSWRCGCGLPAAVRVHDQSLCWYAYLKLRGAPEKAYLYLSDADLRKAETFHGKEKTR